MNGQTIVLVAALLILAPLLAWGIHRELGALERTALGRRGRPYRKWREQLAYVEDYRPRHRRSTLAEQMQALSTAFQEAQRSIVDAFTPALSKITVAMSQIVTAVGASQAQLGDEQRTALEKARRRP